jgi:hypothetical protein
VALTLCFLALGPLGYAASGAAVAGANSLFDTTTTDSTSTDTSSTDTTTTTTTDSTSTDTGSTTTGSTSTDTSSTDTTTTDSTSTDTTTTTTSTDTTTTTTTTTTDTTSTDTTTTTAGTTTTSPATTSAPPPHEPTPPPPPQATTVAAPVTTERPPEVSNLRAVAGDTQVRLTYELAGGVDHVTISRSSTNGDSLTVYDGKGTSFNDRGLANGVEYRYVVRSVDANGNSSAGVAIAVTPRRNLLRTPKDGAKVKKPPKLVWTRNAEASYYNVQLFRGQAKILSTWPVAPAFQLKRTWKYLGKKYTLGKGVYRWYVWPGFGARAKVDYGDLLGSNSFQMTR